MHTFATTRDAKEYLISQLVADANRQGVALSETERKMMYYSEAAWTLPDMEQVSLNFSLQFDTEKYERKMGTLAHRYEQHIRRTSRSELELFLRAERMLREEDHYLLVLVRRGGGSEKPASILRDRIKLVLVAATIVTLVMAAILLFAHS